MDSPPSSRAAIHFRHNFERRYSPGGKNILTMSESPGLIHQGSVSNQQADGIETGSALL